MLRAAASRDLEADTRRFGYRHRSGRARLTALAATAVVHSMIVAIVAYNWPMPERVAPRDDPAIVTYLPAAPDQPAAQPVRGMVGESEQLPEPAAPEIIVPAIPLPAEQTIQVAAPVVARSTPDDGGMEEALAQVTQAYRRAVRDRLQTERRYPAASLLNGYEGAGLIVFRIDRAGQLIDAEVESTTGHRELDRAVLALVHRAAPFPAIPAQLPDELEIGFPVEFLIVKPEMTFAAR